MAGVTINGATAAEEDVVQERRRQVQQEGFYPSRDDDLYAEYQLGRAAASYAWAASSLHDNRIGTLKVMLWPWSTRWWKPGNPAHTARQRRRRMLVKAGALILAQIEQLDRWDEIKKSTRPGYSG